MRERGSDRAARGSDGRTGWVHLLAVAVLMCVPDTALASTSTAVGPAPCLAYLATDTPPPAADCACSCVYCFRAVGGFEFQIASTCRSLADAEGAPISRLRRAPADRASHSRGVTRPHSRSASRAAPLRNAVLTGMHAVDGEEFGVLHDLSRQATAPASSARKTSS